MTVAIALLAPLLLWLPAADPRGAEASPISYAPASGAEVAGGGPPYAPLLGGWRGDSAEQVRIEQHIIVRIPLGPPPMPPDMLDSFARPDPGPRLIERKMGDCVIAAGIDRMVVDGDRRLVLLMRDNDMVGLTLERACHPRDFYSGFYFARQPDGKLCVARDTLLSRTGASCKLTRIRRLLLIGR